MPLTREQFSKLRERGLSVEQITKFDALAKPQGALDVAESVIGGAGELASKPLVPQTGIGRDVTEAALTTAGGFVPGGRAAAEPFLKSPETRAVMGVGAGLGLAPLATVSGLAGGAVGEAVAPEGRKAVGGLVGSLAGIGTGTAIGAGVRALAGKSAAGVINSLIKPKNKAFQFGKNPGAEVAKRGIVGNSFEQLGRGIESHIASLSDDAISLASKAKKTVNLQPALKPIYTALDDLKQNPKTNASAITKIENLLSDIIGITRGKGGRFTGKRPLSKMSATDAVKIKQGVGKIARFTGAEDVPAFPGLVHRVYHGMRTQIEGSVPGLKPINASIANLIGAAKAIPGAVARSAKQPLGGLASMRSAISGGLGGLVGGGVPGAVTGLAINKALTTPMTATRIASGLSKVGRGGLLKSLRQ